ncbi:hypothetical protein SNEBB_000848, partial [Seison nebaliae]
MNVYFDEQSECETQQQQIATEIAKGMDENVEGQSGGACTSAKRAPFVVPI